MFSRYFFAFILAFNLVSTAAMSCCYKFESKQEIPCHENNSTAKNDVMNCWMNIFCSKCCSTGFDLALEKLFKPQEQKLEFPQYDYFITAYLSHVPQRPPQFLS